MSAFQLNAVSAPQPVNHVQQVQSPKPPKAQSDHKPENPVTSSRGPAVVLSGAFAKAPDKSANKGSDQGGDKSAQQAGGASPFSSLTPATGQHVNRVL